MQTNVSYKNAAPETPVAPPETEPKTDPKTEPPVTQPDWSPSEEPGKEPLPAQPPPGQCPFHNSLGNLADIRLPLISE